MINISCTDKELTVKAPPSKSVFHRELIVNYILGARGDFLLTADGDSNDIKATKECLAALADSADGEDIILPARESGSTLRFMIPVALALTGGRNNLVFKTEGRLIARPLEELSDCLAPHGITITKDMEASTVICTGKLTPGRYVIDGSVSSQYISGLIMALSFFDEASEVEVTGKISSIHYIELTTGVLAKYGIDVALENNIFKVPGRTTAKAATGDFEVEGDWSNGAFLLCLGSLIRNGGVKVEGLDPASAQGDKKITEFLKGLGIDITSNGNLMETRCSIDKTSVSEVTMECDDIPDIVPYMPSTGASPSTSAPTTARWASGRRCDVAVRSREDAASLRSLARQMYFSNEAIDGLLATASAAEARCVSDFISSELGIRARNKRERLYRRASFPSPKSLDGYDFSQVAFPDGYGPADLMSLSFVERAEDFVFLGPTGRGKTHLAIAVGTACVNAGRAVRFFTTAQLVLLLTRASRSGDLERLMADIARCDLIVLDEFGYVPIDVDGARLLFQVMSDCYERRSMILTTNIEFSRWGVVLGDDKLASALIDRIVHHGRLVEFGGASRRMEEALMLGKGGGNAIRQSA